MGTPLLLLALGLGVGVPFGLLAVLAAQYLERRSRDAAHASDSGERDTDAEMPARR